jgi:hypothetical protein
MKFMSLVLHLLYDIAHKESTFTVTESKLTNFDVQINQIEKGTV